MRIRVLAGAIGVLITTAVLPGGPAAARAAGPETAKGLSQPVYSQSVVETYDVPTPYGTIHGTVRRPVVPAGVEVPVILTYSPYNTSDSPSDVVGPGYSDDYYVPRGYARAWFDLVGTRDSGGCTDFGGIRERATGKAVVDFLGTRDWSNGRVGMIGVSYDGTTQWAAAVERPEHLVTIVPQAAITRWYDYAFYGGVRRFSGYGTPLAFDFGYGATPSTDPRDPVRWAGVAVDRVNPCDRVKNNVRGYSPDPVYDSYWDERDYETRVSNVKASVLIESGWLDTNVNPVGGLRMFQALPDDHPKKLVLGQWGHSDARFPDSNDIRHAWFDYWLLGYDGKDDDDDLPDTGVMALPRVDTGLAGGVRVQSDTWPPAGTTEQSFPIGGPGGLVPVAGTDATYSGATPLQSPSGQAGGACAGDTCAVFRGEPIPAPLRISGAPRVDLTAVTRALDPYSLTVSTQFAVTLFSTSVTGVRTVLSTGLLNSRNRNGERVSEDTPNGAVYSGTVQLYDTDRVVPAGARLGVAVSAYHTDAFTVDDDGPTSTEIVLTGDARGASTLRLPVAPLPGS